MLDQQNVNQLRGATVQDSSGAKIGTVEQIYLDDNSGQPTWATVRTGMFGSKESFLPLEQASFSEGAVTVPVTKDQVKGAPQVESDGHLEPNEEAELYRYYGLSYGADNDIDASGTVGHDVSGPTTDQAMTRSEERLDVGTEQVQTGRARLRKYVTTQTESVQVPVSREEVRVEREPITDANRDAALNGPELSEEEHEVTLTEERPVVAKETVPVERVRLDKDVVTDTAQVAEEVRAEQIDVDADQNVRGDSSTR
ncbi:MAG: PRC and DUF2382 domain-containing protein [Actinomycetota bacterium]|nr:PRC and DUF2382 domain-containing protein [Actinomycetota bacterium]